MKEQATPTPTPPCGQPKDDQGSADPHAWNYLKPATATLLRTFDCPELIILELGKLKHWPNAMNQSSNPIAAYVTLATKVNKLARRFRILWMPQQRGAIRQALAAELRMSQSDVECSKLSNKEMFELMLSPADHKAAIKRRILTEGATTEQILAAWAAEGIGGVKP